jgi:hypothetical protein
MSLSFSSSLRGATCFRLLLALVSFSLGFCLTLQAQVAALSTIRGTVRDPSGAAVPNVVITVTNVHTGVTRAPVTTNASGDYEVPDLLLGTYTLKATHTGFSTFVASNVILESSETRRIDIVLEVGSTRITVAVTSGASVINTETGALSTSLTGRQVYVNPEEMGGAGYEAYPFGPEEQAPGANNAKGATPNSFNGIPTSDDAQCQDGVCENTTVSQDNDTNDVSEVKTTLSNAPAEYMNPATIELIYKSGTNQFHGNFDGELDNSALDTRDFFSPTRTVNIREFYGIHAGGPIKKDKAWFYGGWDHIYVPAVTPETLTVPTDAFRNGDFSQLLSESQAITIKNPLTGVPFTNNIIPSGMLSSTSMKIENKFFPSPNRPGLVNNYYYVFPAPDDVYELNYFNARGDYAPSSKNRAFVRFQGRFNPYYLPAPTPYPSLGYTETRNHQNYVFQDTEIISPTLVNDARVGWLRDYVDLGSTERGFTPLHSVSAISQMGIQGVNSEGLNIMGAPAFTFDSITSFEPADGGVSEDQNSLLMADDLSWVKGRHIMKFGGEYRKYWDLSTGSASNMFGEFGFTGSLSGYDYSDFLLGLPYTSSQTNIIPNRTENTWMQGLFAEDSFKLTPRLTLNYGLRWDYISATNYSDGMEVNWNPTTGAIVVPADVLNKVSPIYPSDIKIVTGQVLPNPYKGNFRPRIGIAYRLTDHTVIRGGFGEYTLPNVGVPYSYVNGGGPFQISENYVNSVTNGVPLFSFPDAFPPIAGTAPSQSAAGYPLNLHNGVIDEFNVSLEREFHHTGFQLSYVGNRTYSLPYSWSNVDEPAPSTIPWTTSRDPFPQFTSASLLEQNGAAKFDSLQFTVTRKMAPVTLEAAWTYGNNLQNDENVASPYDPLQWAESTVFTRQRLSWVAGYHFPVGPGQRFLSSAHGVANIVLGGWRVMYIGLLATGNYFSPSFSGSDPSNTGVVGGLPNRVCNGNKPSGQRYVSNFFDAACFAVPTTPGYFGNSGADVLVGPGYNVQDFALLKNFHLIGERLTMTYEMSCADCFNIPNFDNPAANISAPGTVGHISSEVSFRDVTNGEGRAFEQRLIFRW